MRFFAFIDPKSAIHKQWRAGNRISGLLDGALFRWNPIKRIFEATELPDESVGKFLVRQDQAVILETLRVLPEESQQGVGLLDEQQLVKAPVEQQVVPLPDKQQDAAVSEQQQDAVAEPQQVDDRPAESVQKPLPRRRVLPE